MLSLDEVKKQLIEVGLEDIIQSGDKTEIHFVLKDGTTLTLYTTEVEVDYVNPSGYVDGSTYVQSEVRFMKGDLA